MKQFNQKFYLLVLILTILGFLCLILGFAFGGSATAYIDASGIHFGKYENKPYEQEIKIESLEKIDADLSMTEVKILKSDENKVVMSGANEKLKPQVEVVDGVLHINTSKKKNFHIGIFGAVADKEATITIYIKDDLKELKLENSYTDMKIKDINAKSLQLESSFSEVNFSGTFEELDISNDFGEVTRNVKGNMTSKIENDFGDIKITYDQALENYNLKCESDFGDIKINGQNWKDVLNRIAGNGNIKIENDFGDVELLF